MFPIPYRQRSLPSAGRDWRRCILQSISRRSRWWRRPIMPTRSIITTIHWKRSFELRNGPNRSIPISHSFSQPDQASFVASHKPYPLCLNLGKKSKPLIASELPPFPQKKEKLPITAWKTPKLHIEPEYCHCHNQTNVSPLAKRNNKKPYRSRREIKTTIVSRIPPFSPWNNEGNQNFLAS